MDRDKLKSIVDKKNAEINDDTEYRAYSLIEQIKRIKDTVTRKQEELEEFIKKAHEDITGLQKNLRGLTVEELNHDEILGPEEETASA